MEYIIVIAIFVTVIIVLRQLVFKSKLDDWKIPNTDFSAEHTVFLLQEVPFYTAISTEEKKHFIYKIQEFLLNCRITGIKIFP